MSWFDRKDVKPGELTAAIEADRRAVETEQAASKAEAARLDAERREQANQAATEELNSLTASAEAAFVRASEALENLVSAQSGLFRILIDARRNRPTRTEHLQRQAIAMCTKLELAHINAVTQKFNPAALYRQRDYQEPKNAQTV